MSSELGGGGGASKRLSVIQGHLNPGKSYSCQGGSGTSSGGAASNKTGNAGSKKRLQHSAPMSSTKDEVQRAFPKKRYATILEWASGYSGGMT